MPRRAARTDANQPEIVAALRAAGCSVASAAALGGGFPDLVVGRGGRTFLLEVKDPAKDVTHRALTPAQRTWHDSWRGHVVVVETVEQALAAVGLA